MALEYGFFNAKKTGVDEEGMPIYDRTYDAESFNDYFEGLISTTGVFAQSGLLGSNNVSTPFEAKLLTDRLGIAIGPGKAVIGGYWAKIEGNEIVSFENSSTNGNRLDMVALRLYTESYPDVNLQRTVQLVAVKSEIISGGGYPKQMIPNGNNLNIEANFPYYSGNIDLNNNKGYVDLPLYYVQIDRNVPTLTNISKVTSQIGGRWCPYISHLILGPSQSDVDAFIGRMKTSLLDFANSMMSELSVDTKIVTYEWTFNCNNESSFALSDRGYKYNSMDSFNVYYNGLKIPTNGYTITRDTAGNASISMNPNRALPPGNVLHVQIVASFVGEFPFQDGDNMKW